MHSRTLAHCTLILGLIALPAVAAAQLPAVRHLDKRLAVTADSFGRFEGAVMSNGATTLVDRLRRRVIRLDPTLSEAVTLFDATTPPPLTLPTVPPRFFLGQGDTVYMTDLPQRGVRVISPTGEIRRQSFADYEDLVRITSTAAGAQFGSHGDVFIAVTMVRRVPGDFSAEPHDSLYLVHLDFTTRRADTLGIIDSKRSSVQVPGDSVPGQPRPMTTYFAPFDIGDAIALNSRGELAVIRASDFHVDWLMPDGKWRRSPPIPWEWKKFSDNEKRAITSDRDSFYSSGRVVTLQRAGTPQRQVTMRSGPIPDVAPAFAPMSAFADPNGLIWLQLGPRSPAYTVPKLTYGAIDSEGRLVDRISLPEDRRLIGVDKAGRFYAATRSGHVEVYQPK